LFDDALGNDERLRSKQEILFYKLKAAQCAVEGGLTDRARSCLLQSEAFAPSLPPQERGPDPVTSLLRGNLELLWGRFYQVTHLPSLAKPHLERAATIITGTSGGSFRLVGIELLLARCVMGIADGIAEATERLKEAESKRAEDTTAFGSPFGPLLGHYLDYTSAYLAMLRGDPAQLGIAVRTACAELERERHGTLIDPVRKGFLDVLEAVRLSAEARQSGSRSHSGGALRLFLEARASFKRIAFWPGAYLALSRYISSRVDDTPPLGQMALLDLRKEARQLADLSRVRVFALEVRSDLAAAYLAVGRIDAANLEARRALSLAVGQVDFPRVALSESDQPELAVLKRLPAVSFAGDLLKRTNGWSKNSVSVAAPWGVSNYAAREQAFVEKLAQSGRRTTSVVISGPVGSARSLLVRRIHSLREYEPSAALGRPLPQLLVVRCSGKVASQVMKELKSVLETENAVVLSNFDELALDGQLELLRGVRQSGSRPGQLYLTMRHELAKAHSDGLLASGVFSQFSDTSWDVLPLNERKEDTIPLARGFLVQGLISQGWKLEDAEKVTFSGRAARRIWYDYSHTLSRLYVAMTLLASRLGRLTDFPEFDSQADSSDYGSISAHSPAGRLRLLEESLLTHVPPLGDSTNQAPNPAPGHPRRTVRQGKRYGRALLQVSAETVAVLALEYDGNLSRLAAEAGVKRSTLVKAWRVRGVLKVWHEGGGRRRRGTRRTE